MTVPDATEAASQLTDDFRWGAVPAVRDASVTTRAALADPSLGGLVGFRGPFRGNGLNTIFRPQNFAVSPTKLPKPAHGPSDNILQLNLTEESLAFSGPLGSIPNRGFVQGDAFLNGIPYVQKVKDVTDPAHPVDIHFEPGVWLAIPKTLAPEEDPSVARMASIPHGTTIEAQGTSFTVAGGPRIDPVDITPFPIGDPSGRLVNQFPSQDVADESTFRIPQDLSSFSSAGTITKEILANPNIVLDDRAKKQNITSTTVIIISTNPASPLFGGGTDNIAFLLGDKDAAKPNADAAQMDAIFWIETVSERITLPTPFRPGVPLVVPGSTAAGKPVPSFAIRSDKPLPAGTPIDVTYTQIQYTQTVLLNFNGLSWPHVSVATLVPEHPVRATV